MELKKLEAKGFKSFGDKIVINFDKGITGIVGPNGCGKSNVVDAIRWVLGEQKIKNLRSDKMQNIIFNGTNKRKPLQLAEVSLTFSNTKNILPTEYSEVTTTRKYYRSGESEYQLNGVTCRLKDIQSLFADTGIGPDSYAIIELAMVDNILQNKDGARRVIFEEAAGISKFKTRKKQTLKKLEDTDADLERVEDLVFEIEKNMRSLERQARQTKRYYELKEDYKTSSLKLARLKIEDQRKMLDEIKRSIEEQEKNRTSFQAENSKIQAEIEKVKAELIQNEKELSQKQKAVNEQLSVIRSTENEKQIKNERLKFLNNRIESLKEDLDQDKKLRDKLEFSIKGIDQDLQKLEKDYTNSTQLRSEQEKETITSRNSVQSILEKHQSLERENRETEKEYEKHSRNVEIGSVQIQTLESQLQESQESKSEQEKTVAGFEERLKDIIEKEGKAEEKVKNAETEYQELESQRERSESEVKTMEKDLDKLLRKLEAKENEFRLTQSMVDNLEGYPEAIKFLNKDKGWAKKAPLLSDIISTSEEYRLAIENYLEPVLNHYVVENQAEAIKAIDLLSGSSKGKANFFLLDSLRNKKSQKPEILNQATPATEVVEFEEKYRDLIQFLLGDVLIVRTVSEIPNKTGDAIWITADSKVVRRKFSITGGSVGLFEGKRIGRIKNLQNLKKEISKLQKEVESLTSSLKNKEASLEETRSKLSAMPITEMKEELQKIHREKVEFESRKEQINQILSEGQSKKESIGNKIEELKRESENSLPQVSILEAKLESLSKQLVASNSELESSQEDLKTKEARLEELKFNEIRLENELKSLVQDKGYKANTLEEIKNRIVNNTRQQEENQSSVKDLLQNDEIQEKGLVELYEKKEKLEKDLNKTEKDYYGTREKIEELESKSRRLSSERETVDGTIANLKDRLNEFQLDLTSVKERLAVEFEVDFEAFLKTEVDNSISSEDLIQQVDDLKIKIERIGAVNPMALEAFEEVKERHSFILEQREDLQKAKESLLLTIEEIDKVATETFESAFNEIRDNFIKVFRTLFSEGDTCDLKLVDPEDPLNSEIEITAKPKGKRPLTINQLSGGEKTLTATSLLFAVYLLKPAPFCVFDEVDAPLDDANIDKFNNIINEFSAGSQFIIVTHNKRTMANTQMIYGITMIENGVSRVVPVDLGNLN